MSRLEEILVIVGVFLLLFGADRIPKVAKSFGEGIQEFKKALNPESKDSKEKKSGKGKKG
jgi:sec-independent protein translocase protein TatA